MILAQWVLIWVVYYLGNGAGASSETFSSKEKCMSAGQNLKEIENGFSHIKWICVKK